MSQFGKKRLADFYLDPTYVNINHGSYGSTPRVVMEYKRKMEEQCDFNTEKWFRGDSEQLINQMRAYIAQKVNSPTKNIFIVQNATDGFNCFMKSLKWNEGDIVLLPSTAYSCIRKTCMVLRDRYGITILDLPLNAQDLQSPESIQLKVQDFVNAYPKKIKLAIFDHIISVPAIILPVDSLQAYFEEKGIPLFIDGAHAIGQVRIDLKAISPAGYFSNFHKWSYAPKNAAFLYISDKYLDTVRPVITGNFCYEGPQREFYWTGTRDYSSYLSIRKGIEYLESFGENAVYNYNHNLAIAAAKRVADIWKTKLLTADTRCIGYLINVEVPSNDLNGCVQIAKKMMTEVNCYPIFFEFDGKVYIRLSAQIYNELSDYEFAANKILEYLSKQEILKH